MIQMEAWIFQNPIHHSGNSSQQSRFPRRNPVQLLMKQSRIQNYNIYIELIESKDHTVTFYTLCNIVYTGWGEGGGSSHFKIEKHE